MLNLSFPYFNFDKEKSFRQIQGLTRASCSNDLAEEQGSRRDASTKKPQLFSNNSITTTKYNVVTFLPRALFEQFRRLANFYFLAMSILMLMGTYTTYFDSPLKPWATLLPLILMLSIIMSKEAMEDFKRHLADNETNNRKALRLLPTTKERAEWEESWEIVPWKVLYPGNIVLVEDRSEIPADIVLLLTSEKAGVGYVETSNIDGETNLKIKESAATSSSGNGPEWDCTKQGALLINSWTFLLECEPENERIHSFVGTLSLESPETSPGNGKKSENSVKSTKQRTVPLEHSNLLLRGSSLRNTKWAIGIVAYTGGQSKMAMNSSLPPSKFSNLERTVNRLIWVVFGAHLLLATISVIGLTVFKDLNIESMYYVCYGPQHAPTTLYQNCRAEEMYPDGAYWFSFFILYNNFIPISIYVTIEVVNYIQAYFIGADITMYDSEVNIPALARTSNMNSDLGQISHIFSDKTGTLTRNIMKFKACSVNGQIYGDTMQADSVNFSLDTSIPEDVEVGAPLNDLKDKATTNTSAEFLFLLCMAVCHTVLTETGDDGNVTFQAESPDEEALVWAAKECGFNFVERYLNSVTVCIHNKRATYEVLAVLPFDSDRKRMSVVVKTPEGKFLVLSKGADNVMLELASSFGNSAVTVEVINEHLDEFASEGLRILVLASRDVRASELKSWLKRYKEAAASLQDRPKKIAAAAAELEKNFTILGITAIEDKLQDEVPEVIQSLQGAGAKIWMLTGDKVETAINIGYSCRLLLPDMALIRLQNSEGDKSIKDKVKLLHQRFKRVADDTQTFGKFWGTISNKSKSESVPGSLKDFPDLFLMPPPQDSNEDGQIFTNQNLAIIVDGNALLEILGDTEAERKFLELTQLCISIIACRVSPLQKRLLVRLVKTGVEEAPMTLAIGDGANDVGMIQEAQVGVCVCGKEGRQALNSSDFAIAQFKFLRTLMLVHGRWNYRRISKVVLYSFYKNMVLAFILFYFTCFSAWSGQSLYESYIYSGYNFFLGMPIICIGIFNRDMSVDTAMKYPTVYKAGLKNLDMGLKIMVGWLVQGCIESLVIFFFCWNAYQYCAGIMSNDGQSDGLWVFGTLVFSCLVFSMLFKAAFLCWTWTGITYFFWFGSMLLFFLFIFVYGSSLSLSYNFYFVSYEMVARPTFWLLLVLLSTFAFLLDLLINALRLEYLHNPTDHAMEFDRGCKSGKRHSSQVFSADNQNIRRISNFCMACCNFFRTKLGLKPLSGEISERSQNGAARVGSSPKSDSTPRKYGSRRFSSSFAFDFPTKDYGPGSGKDKNQSPSGLQLTNQA